jgi:sulfite reductase (NADPH) flavoprotein alpha-component
VQVVYLMTTIDFAGAGLTVQQWEQVRALARSLTPGQRLWLTGYFAGLNAAWDEGASAAILDATPSPSQQAGQGSRTLTILYGSETGNSAALASSLADTARGLGRTPTVVDMADYKTRRLKDEQDLLIVVSTYGEGDPPQPAADFFEFVEGRKAPQLPNLRYAVLALGDSTYEKYCEAGKRLDRRLEELHAVRLYARADCDVDYDDPAAIWMKAVLPLVVPEEVETPQPQPGLFAAPRMGSAPAFDKRNPFAATITENIVLTGRGSSKETRHIEMTLAGSGLSFLPGDALGIVPRNDPALVDAMLDCLGAEGDAPIGIKDRHTTLRDALETHFEIMATTPRFLDHWAALSGAAELERLIQSDDADARAAFMHGHHIIDIMRAYPIAGLEAQTFVTGLRPLQPRLYSIASSFAALPDEVHLTVATVRYALHGQPRAGVASGHLAEFGAPDATVPVYVQPNPHFRLPDDDAPIIMIGAGTGVAPYRAFLQEREVRGASAPAWLFFGERNFRTDFLYQTEWQAYLKDGLLTRMDVAFSRDGQKVYVQHRLREQADALFGWLEDGAHLYVCGDAARLAPDVHEALCAIVQSCGGLEAESAEEYLRDLQHAHRYQRDVY